ncbi:hypothetical protein Zmor_021537 [Zophobas morio]|uniref:Uncharacterized protein n=1 Tax=Zophobas morio TaxID=2755281 RepID=A0AA38I5U5_9CUCU|nr:hypothetical protein Zmor_021537 [Zophobas morio]
MVKEFVAEESECSLLITYCPRDISIRDGRDCSEDCVMNPLDKFTQIIWSNSGRIARCSRKCDVTVKVCSTAVSKSLAKTYSRHLEGRGTRGRHLSSGVNSEDQLGKELITKLRKLQDTVGNPNFPP